MLTVLPYGSTPPGYLKVSKIKTGMPLELSARVSNIKLHHNLSNSSRDETCAYTHTRSPHMRSIHAHLKKNVPIWYLRNLFEANSLTKTDLLYFKKGLTKHNTVHFKMTSLSEVRLRVQANWRASDRTDGRTASTETMLYVTTYVASHTTVLRCASSVITSESCPSVPCVRPSGYPQHSRIVDISCR